jgi:Skp family chaperone for outer membrane proteins
MDQENFQGALDRMKPKFALLAALAAGLLPVAAVAQAAPAAAQPAAPAATSAPAAPAPTAAPAATPAPQAPVFVPPSAFPARIAIITFEYAVANTNEGQRAMEDLRKKYQPQQTQLQNLAAEIDSLKKQLQAAPATLSDEERAARLKTIDTKDKQYQRDSEDFSTSSQADLQEALGKVAQKVDVVMRKYVSDNGYTLLLNAGDQSSPVMWAATQPNADITMAVIEAYNAASKVAPLPPAAPAAAARPKPAATTPHTTPAAKPAAK